VPKLDGILFFPVTPFDSKGRLDTDLLGVHVDRGLGFSCGAVFAACGTGEFHALDSHEHRQVVGTAIKSTQGRAPVFAGVGGPISVAREQLLTAAEAGADGALIMPPYLRSSPSGFERYIESLAATCDLPVIVYHRDNATLTPETAARIAQIPSVFGVKDGVGDIGLMSQIVASVGKAIKGGDKHFQFFNGLATAEMTVRAYRAIGVDLYSSAAFAFAPEIATAYWRALDRGDGAHAAELIERFFAPLAQLRDAAPGYAVSLVKAGVALRGLSVGDVRPPLTAPTPEHLAQLERILSSGLEFVGA
jgi:5-dehydro-4-deoxyglucarate dehydratase